MADNDQGSQKRLDKDRIFASARALCIRWTHHALPQYLDHLADKLFKTAEKADNNADQRRYFQAREEIHHHRSAIENRFVGLIEHACEQYFQGRNTTTDFNLDPMQTGDPTEVREKDLDLIDKTELEEKLAVASLARRCCADNSEALYALNQRLSALRGGAKVTDHSNPFAPGVFAEALQSTLADFTLDETARLLIYKIFENTLMANLKSLYSDLNTELKNAGILPNLQLHIKKTPEEVLADLPEELKNQLSDISINRQLALIHAIQVLQSQLAPNPLYRRPVDVAPISAAQLLNYIQQLQSNAGMFVSRHPSQQTFAVSDIASWRKPLEEHLRRTDELDENVIEIVGLLFEYMLNDEHLPDSAKSLLSYLHTPFLKIALLDKEFFNRPDHPARQLLNSLVAAGERWVEPHSKRKSDVFEQMHRIVQRVLTGFNNDIRLFSELVFEFNHYLRQHSRRIRLAEKRSQQAALGENKMKEIRHKVENYIKAKTDPLQLSPTIETLLFEPWANFLAFNLLRFGSDSEQWRRAAQVVDDLIWYCLPHDVTADIHARKRIEELQQSLPAMLRTGFETVGYDHVQGEHLIDIIGRRSGETLAQAPAKDIVEPPAADIDQIDINPQTPPEGDGDPLLDKLRNLSFDTWFEFRDEEGLEPVQAKLAWTNRRSLLFMFVNRLGQQVATKSGAELARELRDGKTRIMSTMEGKPFFEKAMEGVLEQIKQRQATKGD